MLLLSCSPWGIAPFGRPPALRHSARFAMPMLRTWGCFFQFKKVAGQNPADDIPGDPGGAPLLPRISPTSGFASICSFHANIPCKYCAYACINYTLTFSSLQPEIQKFFMIFTRRLRGNPFHGVSSSGRGARPAPRASTCKFAPAGPASPASAFTGEETAGSRENFGGCAGLRKARCPPTGSFTPLFRRTARKPISQKDYRSSGRNLRDYPYTPGGLNHSPAFDC